MIIALPTDRPFAADESRIEHDIAPLRVAMMGRSLRGQFSGVVRYTDELIRALATADGVRLDVFLTRADDGLDALPITRRRAPFPTPNEYTRALWEQCVVPFGVRRTEPDVYHSPNYILPVALRCPSVVTVHDMAFLDRSVHRLRSHLYLSVLTAIAMRKATRVVCVSSYTGERLAARFPSVRPKIRIVGEGISSRFMPQERSAVEAFRARCKISTPYVLFVGTVEPRKNLARLIRSFEVAVRREGLPHHLVIAGASGWKTGPVRAAYEQSAVRDRIQFIGYVDDAELPAAYAGADVFAYPSLHEGYGLPPLEAMACGTPVITSSTTALAEIAGPAAATVHPEDEKALADTIASVLTHRGRHERLANAGLAHAARFRWDAVADEMIQVYREAAR